MKNNNKFKIDHAYILISSIIVPIVTPFIAGMFVSMFRDQWGFGQGILFLFISILSLVVGMILSISYIVIADRKYLGILPLILNCWPIIAKQSYADLIHKILNLFI